MISNVTTILNGTEYSLATTLRVAYIVQGMHNHKPYTEVFKGMGDMPIEQQIDILYAAFQCANPEDAKTITSKVFRDYYLDNYNLKFVMGQLEKVVKGILGEEEETTDEKPQGTGETLSEGN